MKRENALGSWYNFGTKGHSAELEFFCSLAVLEEAIQVTTDLRKVKEELTFNFSLTTCTQEVGGVK